MGIPPRTECPICGAKLECVFSRNKASKLFFQEKIKTENWWRIQHARFPSDCRLRYENLGEGETQEEAWKNFQENLQQIS